MTTIVFMFCVAAEGFLLYALANFAFELKSRRYHYQEARNERSYVAPLLFVGPASLAVWSGGTWDRFLSKVKGLEPTDTDTDGRRVEHTSTINAHALSEVAIGRTSRPQAVRPDVLETCEVVADSSDNETSQEKMRIVVIATTPKSTVAALRTANRLAVGLDAQVTLLAMERVPPQFPLQKPLVSIDFLERKLYGLVGEAGIVDSEVLIQLCLCRDPLGGLRPILRPHSLIVIGSQNHWWARRERRLKLFLTRLGHTLFLGDYIPMQGSSEQMRIADSGCEGTRYLLHP